MGLPGVRNYNTIALSNSLAKAGKLRSGGRKLEKALRPGGQGLGGVGMGGSLASESATGA
jgi:hypothetical protein